jgi:hypothetical protein
MDSDSAGHGYPELMRQLAGVQARYAAERQEAQRRYRTQCTAAQAAADEARAAATQTAAGIRAAAAIVEHVDQEAAEIWYALREQASGRLRSQLGVPPEPAPPHEVAQPDESPLTAGAADEAAEPAPVRYLTRAADLVAAGRRRQSLPGRSYAALPILGALGAGIAFAIARGLLLLGHTWHGPVSIVLVAVGQIAVFSSPLAGLPAAKVYADRLVSRLDAGAVALVVIGGMLTVCGLNLVKG